jgi:type VI secretion system secreted protein Hcp
VRLVTIAAAETRSWLHTLEIKREFLPERRFRRRRLLRIAFHLRISARGHCDRWHEEFDATVIDKEMAMLFDAHLFIGSDPSGPPKLKGESTHDKRKDWIEICGFRFEVEQQSSVAFGGGLGTGVVKVGDFSIVKKVDQATPSLYQSCCQGVHFDTVQVRVRKAGGTALDYLVYTFSSALITAVRTGGSSQGADVVPLEEVSFSFAKFKIDYYKQDAKGNNNPPGPFTGGWDIQKKEKA